MLGQRRDVPRQHAHIMDAPARCHAPAGARPGDLYREFGLVDLRAHQPIAWRIFERDVDLLAMAIDMLVAELPPLPGPAARELTLGGRVEPGTGRARGGGRGGREEEQQE